MAVPSSGAISMADFNTSQGVASTTQRSFSDATFLSQAGNKTATAGQNVALTDIYSFSYSATIAASTTDYNMKSAAIAAGWNQLKQLNMSVTINAGVYVYGSSTGVYAFNTGVTFPTGTSLALVNNGVILGHGGNGGTGSAGGAAGGAGGGGGPGFIAQKAISVTNNSSINGGGGGGGGGGGAYV
jgi:hypothetical protein